MSTFALRCPKSRSASMSSQTLAVCTVWAKASVPHSPYLSTARLRFSPFIPNRTKRLVSAGNSSFFVAKRCVQYVRNMWATEAYSGQLSTGLRHTVQAWVEKRVVIHQNVNTFTALFYPGILNVFPSVGWHLSPLSTALINTPTHEMKRNLIHRRSISI